VEVRPSVRIVKSNSDRYIAADISTLASSLSRATVTRYATTLREEKIASG